MYTYQRNYRKIIPEHEKVYHYTTGEKHKFLGDFYTLSVQSTHDTAHVVPQGGNLVLAVNDPKDKEECAFTLDMWYRDQAQEVFLPIVADAVVETAPYKVALPKLRIYRMLDRLGLLFPQEQDPHHEPGAHQGARTLHRVHRHPRNAPLPLPQPQFRLFPPPWAR